MGGTQTADIFDKLHAQAPPAPSITSGRGDIFDRLQAGGRKITPATAAGAYQTRPGGPIQNVSDTSGQRTNYAGLTEIVPKEGETFEDIIKRAIA